MYGIIKITERLKKPILGTLTALALSILICYLNYYVFKITMLPFAIETAFYVLPYTLLGYALSKYQLPQLNRFLSAPALRYAISLMLFAKLAMINIQTFPFVLLRRFAALLR